MQQVTLSKTEFDRLVTFVFFTHNDDLDIVIVHTPGGGIGTITTVTIGDQKFDLTDYGAW
jgi:hypothetical protein